MKALVVTLVLRDDGEVESASNDVGEMIAQHWPMFAWDVRDATEDEVKWFVEEYEGEQH